MVLGNLRAGNGDECLGLNSVIGMFLSQIENELFDSRAHFFERHRGWDAHIQKNICAIRSAADPPGKPAAYAAHVHHPRLATVISFALPRRNPAVYRVETWLHAKTKTVLSL